MSCLIEVEWELQEVYLYQGTRSQLGYTQIIQKIEVEKTLRRMRIRKEVYADGILIEV